MLLVKTLPGGLASIMYAPKGPVWDLKEGEALRALLAGIHQQAQKRRSIFVQSARHPGENVGEAKPFCKVWLSALGGPLDVAGIRHVMCTGSI